MGRHRLLPDPRLSGGSRQADVLRILGACAAQAVDDLFFSDDRVDEAKAMCLRCPVRQVCLDHALRHENFGVWGGTTPAERDKIRGVRLVGTPEDARWADAIRDRARQGSLLAEIARDMRVSVRTLERWFGHERDQVDGVA
jgi:WhiB family redox-sensing transcriptional regulator